MVAKIVILPCSKVILAIANPIKYIKITPAVNPSSPSSQLKAFVMPDIQITVTKRLKTGDKCIT